MAQSSDAEKKVKARRDALERIRSLVELYNRVVDERGYKGYDTKLMRDLRVVDADPTTGVVTWELDVDGYWANMNGVMHGGAHATIFDMCTSFGISMISKPGYWEFLAGVSRILNISYLKAVPIGVTVRIKTQVEGHGKSMALASATMESPDGKIKYSTVQQHKFHTPTRPELAELVREWWAKWGEDGGRQVKL